MFILAFVDGPTLVGGGISVLALLFDLAVLVLLIWALIVVLKLPALLERQASIQHQSQQLLREILIEIRSVTKAQ